MSFGDDTLDPSNYPSKLKMDMTAYLIAIINVKTGKVEQYGTYSEPYPTFCFKREYIQAIVAEADGTDYETALANLKQVPDVQTLISYKAWKP